MALNPKDLADKINEAMGATDKDGKSISTTAEMLAYATAIISTIQAASCFHPPFMVQGTAPAAPGPVPDLMANNGKFLPPLNPQVWVGILSAAVPGPNISQEANISTAYIMGAANISFGVSDMTGQSTATPPPGASPGVLVAGAGTGGKISALVGADWASLVSTPFLGDPSLIEKIYTAIVEYIIENIEILYIPQSVNGSFPAVSAPLVAGTGAGGLLT